MKSRGKGRNEIDARVVEHPKETREIVRLDIVEDQGIAIGGPEAVMAIHNTIGELFPEDG